MLVLVLAVSVTLQDANASADETEYTRIICPLERNGTALYLSQTLLSGTQPQKQILLVHGVTYSSHEFDINYRDYSLARLLARNGYGVWLPEIAGFGRSGDVRDGFMADSDYAAEDSHAAAPGRLPGHVRYRPGGYGMVLLGLLALRRRIEPERRQKGYLRESVQSADRPDTDQNPDPGYLRRSGFLSEL